MGATIDKDHNCDRLEEQNKSKEPEEQLDTSTGKDNHDWTDGTVAQQQNPTNSYETVKNATDNKTVQDDNNGEGENTASNESERTTQKENKLQSFNGSTHSDKMGDKTDEKNETKDNKAHKKPSKNGDVTTRSSHDNLAEKEKGEVISSCRDTLTEEEKGEAASSSHDNLTKEEKVKTLRSSQDNLTEEEEKGEAISLHDAFAQTDVTPRMPYNLPAEESNFLRFCHLIQKVAPQAVRHRFDQVFPPADLEGIIQQKMTVLKDLYHNRIITRPQWKLICPFGRAPLSATFDLTTMVCLFRHLTNTGNYDILPPPSDVSLGADLSRIKCYRNNIAHYLEKDRKIDNNDFPIVWETASMAVSRIGGQIYEQECSSLRTANLDSSYMDIYREVLIKETIVEQKIFDLAESQQQLQNEHEKKIYKLQSEHDREIKQLQIKLEDPVPKHERENINLMTNKWEANNYLFIETSAATHLINVMKTENVAIVTGSPGTGKTFTVQNVLLSMREEGYDVIPVRSSSDLVRYFSRSDRQVFFLDNLCGKHNISNSDIEEWDRNHDTLLEIFAHSSTRCIFICRLQIFLDPKFQNLKLKEFNVINLNGAQQLTLEEKQSIGQIHIGKSIMEQLIDQTIITCLCFPLLCSLYAKHDKHTMNTTAYFEKPKKIFETELTEMRERPDKTKYGCIALCVMLNNKVDLDFFHSTNEEGRRMARVVFNELGVNAPTMKALKSCFDSMVGSYFQNANRRRRRRGLLNGSFKKIPLFKSIHDYMFDINCVHVSKTMIETIILYGDSELIRDRALLQSIGEHNENAIVVPVEFEQVYFERMLKDLSSCRVSDVFGNNQMKYESYRSKFKKFLDLEDFDVNIRDETGIRPIHKASEAGYVDVVEMLCNKGADINLCGQFGLTALTVASFRGHIDVVQLLCNKGAGVNITANNRSTPLTAASTQGHIDVVELLCNKGADVNLSGKAGSTPLMAASGEGHIDVVELLCNKGADVNLSGMYGSTPLTAASGEGHIDVVKLLCKKGADVNLRKNFRSTPLTAASERGHIDVVELLCNKGADVNLSGKYGWTLLKGASGGGHIDVVELLCNKGEDINLNGKFGWTPLTAASRNVHLNVVELLCNKGADMNLRGKFGFTALTFESGRGRIDALELLCDKGADVNLSDAFGMTPLMTASEGGCIDAVELLCNKGAEVNLVGKCGLTPLTAASKRGHTDVVELLCNKGADVNLRGDNGLTPLEAASLYSRSNVVELLRKKGAT